MHAVTFVLPDEIANVSISGLQWFILIPRLTTLSLTGQLIPIPYPNYIKKKNIGFRTRTTQPAAVLRITRKAAVRL